MNLRLAGDTVPSAVLHDTKSIVTSAVGSVSNTIVYVAVHQFSSVDEDVELSVKSDTSSSVIVTDTVSSGTDPYAESELASSITTFSVPLSSLSISSSIDVTVIVCGTFQLLDVYVILDGEILNSVVSSVEKSTLTCTSGSDARYTFMSPVPPASNIVNQVVVIPLGSIINAAVSSSTNVVVCVFGVNPVYSIAELAFIDTVTTVLSPSLSKLSFTHVTVTVCAVA